MIEQDVIILSNEEIAPNTYFMGFQSAGIATSSSPGQFLMIRVMGGFDPLLRRPFSICTIKDENIVCIVYRVVGKGTGYLARKKKGEKISVLGPLGRGFKVPEKDDKKIVLIAGGIGIAPLFFLAQSMKNKDFEFMAGYPSSKEVIETKLIGELSRDISTATDDGSRGYSGQVTNLLEEYMRKDPVGARDLSIFSCGPIPMLKTLAKIASDKNIPCQISLEALMACGLGACQGCAVRIVPEGNGNLRYHHVCKDGPVFQSRVIDWSLL